MIGNFIRVTIRHITKDKLFHMLNVLGLSIGMGVFILILIFVKNERSFDQFHLNADRIYRAVSGNPNDKNSFAGTPAPLGPFMKKEFPEVKNFVRLSRRASIIGFDKKKFSESGIILADPSIFDIFTFTLIHGTPDQALSVPNSVVITENTAVKYFNNDEPIGKTLVFNDTIPFVVTAVVSNIPTNSHFHFDFLIPFENNPLLRINLNNWGQQNYYTYLLMNDRMNVKDFKQKVNNLVAENSPNFIYYFSNLYYQPLKQIHFQYNRKNLEPAFESKYLNIFLTVAFVILIIACINFMNLTTAKSSKRIKEVCLRKISGAAKSQLVIYFLGEAVLITFFAAVIAFLFVELLLPSFNNLTERNLKINYGDIRFMLMILSTIILTGVFSGLYPAIVLSSFKQIAIMKETYSGKSRSLFRTILVVFQFTVSVIMIVMIIIIHKQLTFVRTSDLGMHNEFIVNVRLQDKSLMDRAPEIKQAFRESPNVLQVSTNGYVPTNMNWNQSVWWKGQQEDERTNMWVMSVDRDFMKTLQIKVVEGKEMINEFKFTDRLAYVLNGSALEQIGWDNALGKEFSIYGKERVGTIVGVVRDFNFRSLHHSIAPCVLLIRDSGQQISVRIRGDQIPETLDYLERKWKEFSKDLPFDYYFLDEEFDKLYKSEMKASRVIGFFTILSLFVACLGLFGLAAYMVQQRTKEIGIRKVNGATVIQIVLLLSTDFAKWILVATLIAWPVAYFTVRSWLQGFEYRTNINFLVFLSAGAIVLIIALVTVSLQTFRAATINPVETLRYE